MGDSQAPPRPPLSPTRSITAMLYYGLLVVGMAAVGLALYHFVIVRWCSYFSDPQSGQRFHPLQKVIFGSSFKYKRDDGADEDSECAVCLSVFEEGEEIRMLPKCNHSFHAPCIDMWLHSHMDCPLCRSAVELPGVQRQPAVVEPPEHSREGLPFPVGLF